MPTYLQGVKRGELTFVLVAGVATYYGFKTKNFENLTGIGVEDIAALGHLGIEQLGEADIKMFGASSPKPPRVRKKIKDNPSNAEQGSASTFVAKNKINDAQAAGWDISTPGRVVSFRSNARTVTASAKLSNGGYYAFPLNAKSASDYATELGLILPASMSSSEREKAMSGTSKPKPPIVGKTITNNDKVGVFSTFCSVDKLDSALQAGWELIKGEFVY